MSSNQYGFYLTSPGNEISMLFFKCRISFRELNAMERYIPNDMYCISTDSLEEFHYGVIKSTMFNKLLNVLSGETLEQLEYLNYDEFQQVVAVLHRNNISFYGNTGLLKE